jgi:protein-tyrosine phosphatase
MTASREDLARSINLRDLGGLQVEGGAVKSGALFRSAALDTLTPRELEALRALNLHAIIDLRHNMERDTAPTPWQAFGCRTYWAHEYPASRGGDLSDLLKNTSLTRETSLALMMQVYETLPFGNVDALQAVFRTAAAGEGPILFHCTAGKDRTGMTAALLLSALGASRDTIYDDYLASLNFDILTRPIFRDIPADRLDMLGPIVFVQREFLDAMFDAIEARNGSVEGFLTETVGLAPSELEAARSKLVA